MRNFLYKNRTAKLITSFSQIGTIATIHDGNWKYLLLGKAIGLTLLGLKSTRLGVKSTRLGVKSTRLGLKSTRLGVKSTRLGLKSTRLGLKSTRLGLKSTRLGLKSTRLGLKSTRLGLKSTCWLFYLHDEQNLNIAVKKTHIGMTTLSNHL